MKERICKIQQILTIPGQPWIFIVRTDVKLKLKYSDYLMQRADSLEKTDPGKDWRQEEKGAAKDEMVGEHHWLNGHKFEQTPGDSEGQESLGFSWGWKELDVT